jgi:hypothetical protein
MASAADQQWDLIQQIVRLEKRISAELKKHDSWVRWTTCAWEKGYPLSIATAIEVYDDQGQVVLFGDVGELIDA